MSLRPAVFQRSPPAVGDKSLMFGLLFLFQRLALLQRLAPNRSQDQHPVGAVATLGPPELAVGEVVSTRPLEGGRFWT